MIRLAESKLLSGFIYGDPSMKEYVYLPGSELDSSIPLLVYEKEGRREDISMEEALRIIEKRSLKPCTHPVLGKNTLG